jgi:hypothetical protein
MYKSIFPISSGKNLESIMDVIFKFMGVDKFNLSKDKYQSYYTTVFNSIISYTYTNKSFELFDNIIEERNRLINGNTSIGYRIIELKKDPKYSKNGFLKNIEVLKDYKTDTYTISFKDPFGTESNDKEVTLGFYNLALDENNDIKELAKDLALYPFATGDAGYLGRYIPVGYYNTDADFNNAMANFEKTYVENITDIKSQEILIDQIVQNNPEIFSKSFSFTSVFDLGESYNTAFKTIFKKIVNADRLKNVNKFTFKVGDFPNTDKYNGIVQSLKIPLTDDEIVQIKKNLPLHPKGIDFKYPQYLLIKDEISSNIEGKRNEKVSYLYKRTSPIVTENGDATYERIEILGYKNISEFDFNNPNLVSVIEMNNVSRDENELNSQEGVLQEEVAKPAMLTSTTSAQEGTSNFASNELLVIEENEIPKKEGESFEEMQKRVIQNLNIRKRIEIAQKNNIIQGKSYSFSEIKKVFNNEKLFENEIYKELNNILQTSNLIFKFGSLNKGKKLVNAYYNSISNSINIDTLVLQTPNLATSDFKRILLHEIIHAATFINLKEGVSLTSTQKTALNNLNNLIDELKKDRDFFGQYGLTNANELLAELANEQFVDKLKKKTFSNNQSFFDKIISEIIKLLGLKTTAYDIVKESFDNLVNKKLQIVNQFTEIKLKIDSSKKINIYSGTGENAELSNFAVRSFTIPENLANFLKENNKGDYFNTNYNSR